MRLRNVVKRPRGHAEFETTVLRVEQQIRRLRMELRKQRRRIEKLHKAEELRTARLRELQQHFGWMGNQVAALETRMAAVDEARSTVTQSIEPSDDPVAVEVRALVEDVRRQHERVRVRFRVISAYEERMRRLEEAVFGAGDDAP
jgi:predicted  nucleic acid-binding Zn-ribbon protein